MHFGKVESTSDEIRRKQYGRLFLAERLVDAHPPELMESAVEREEAHVRPQPAEHLVCVLDLFASGEEDDGFLMAVVTDEAPDDRDLVLEIADDVILGQGCRSVEFGVRVEGDVFRIF